MLLQNSGTRLSQLMNTSGFHRNVGEGNKSFNAMSPDTYLSEAFGKGSGCARLKSVRVHFAPGKIAITLELLGQFLEKKLPVLGRGFEPTTLTLEGKAPVCIATFTLHKDP